MRNYFIAILFAQILTFTAFGQKSPLSQEDSLLLQINNAKHDTSRIRVYNQLAEYYNKSKPETALNYIHLATELSNKLITQNDDEIVEKAKSLLSDSYTNLGDYYKAISDNNEAFESYEKSLKIRTELKDYKGEANNYIDLGIIKSNTSDYLAAEKYYKSAIEIQKKIQDDAGLAKAYRNIGNIYHFQGDPLQAIDYYQQSLVLSEKISDLESVSRCCNNIGYIYTERKLYSWAKEYYNKSLEIKIKLGDQRGIATCYNNLGDVLFAEKKYEEAEENYLKSLDIRVKIKNKRDEAISLYNLGRVAAQEKNYNKADSYFQKSLKINEEITELEQKALLMKEIASNYSDQKKYNQALVYAQKALELGEQLKTRPRKRDAYKVLSEVYEGLNNNKLALEYLQKYIAEKDTIDRAEDDKTIENETKYKVDKKNQEIKNQELLREQEKEKARIQIYSSLGGLLAMLLIAFILYRSYKQKTKANTILEEQKKEIQKAKEEIEAQRDLVIEKNEQVLAAKKEIEDSIIYAKNIQHAVLPSQELRSEIMPEHFIFWRPRNIVSGDFFWMKKVKNFVVITIADCTGHGVPGAFMSMLGLMFLNEIVTTRSLDSSGIILNKLRDKVKTSLHQSGKEGEAKDGMDISFFIIDLDTYELQFSGAFNPLYIIRKNELIKDAAAIENDNIKACYAQDSSISSTLFEIKADRQPIAIYSYEKDFSTNTFQLQKGDCIYSFTDGYPDQFGGEEGKKLNAKRFKELFLTISDKPMKEQEILVEKNFYDWMGNLEQVDDVLLLGMRV
ncbi:MAG: tetratricopeptide repeat protein [Bacteroidales bacterium]